MSNSVRPHRRQPIRLPCPWDSSGKNTPLSMGFFRQEYWSGVPLPSLTMEYYSAIKRTEAELGSGRWMNLEPLMQSEVSQKEKNKYHILTHIYGIQKKGPAEPICRAGTWTQTWRRDLQTQQGKDGTNWKMHRRTHAIMCRAV